MRIVAISSHLRFADSLRAVVQAAGHSVTHANSEEAAIRTCSPASATAVFVHAEAADARLAQTVASLVALGYRPVFAALEVRSAEWEERVLVAGAAFIFHLPWRSNLVLSRLESIPAREPEAPPAQPPHAHQAQRLETESRSPFAPAETLQTSSNALLNRLRGVALILKHAARPETFTATFLDQIREALALNRVALYQVSEGAEPAMECAYSAGIEPSRWKTATFSTKAGIGRWMSEHLVALSLGTMERYGLEPSVCAEMNSLGAQCAIPVQGDDEFLGILLVGSRVTGFPLTNEEIELVYLLCLELGRTIKSGRLNKALARERQFLTDLTEGLGSGCAVFDRRFEVLHVNRELLRICEGGHAHEFTFRSLPKALASIVFEVSSGSKQDAETLFTDPAGSTFLAKVSVFNPQSRAVLLLVDDVSKLAAKHSGDLVNLERELVARLGAQFVHEVRNSLTRLMTFGQMLPVNRKDPAFLDQLEAILPKDLHRVLRHATNLEILSKPTPALRKPVKLHWTVSKAWRELRVDYPDFGAEWLEVDGVPEDAVVSVNPEVFSRVCYELLLNCAQAVEGAETRRIAVTASESPGTRFLLSFEDTGPGFAPELAASAVSPFVTTRNQGLGLGLTLVDKFAREAGAKLLVGKSRKLGGAAVSIDLPANG